ncbi:Chloride channel, voltage gated [Corchorus capsularis]|uniref:Chloride channel, voltage gated n=1 Tax=Corchorus capsularis TaxID=210143 RepID=A0A1R3ISX1_COCAP|nr:Chloride channel, voltage gated [Corchorus capsularis]
MTRIAEISSPMDLPQVFVQLFVPRWEVSFSPLKRLRRGGGVLMDEICNSGRCGLFGTGGLIMFDVSDVKVSYHLMDVIPVIIIGIIGGLLGSLYNHVLHKVLRLYNLINQ